MAYLNAKCHEMTLMMEVVDHYCNLKIGQVTLLRTLNIIDTLNHVPIVYSSPCIVRDMQGASYRFCNFCLKLSDAGISGALSCICTCIADVKLQMQLQMQDEWGCPNIINTNVCLTKFIT